MNKRLLEHLRQSGYIDEANLRAAMARQQQFGGDLLELMLRMKLLSERECARGLASFYRYPVVDLNQTTPEDEALALIDGEYAQSHGLLPLHVDHDGQIVDVAVFDPARTLEGLDLLRRHTHYEPRPYISPPTALQQAIAYFYFGVLPDAAGESASGAALRMGRSAGEGSGPRRMSAGTSSGGTFSTVAPRGALRSTRMVSSAEEAPLGIGGRVDPIASAPKIGALVDPVSVGGLPAVSGAAASPEVLHDLAACQQRIERLEAMLDHERRLVQVLVEVLGEVGVTSREELIKRLGEDA